MNINKNYLLTFGISVLVMFTLSVIVFMLMLPKQSTVAKGTIKNYDSISKSEYTFEATRAISSEPLKKQYSITTEDMNGYKYNNQYKAGNTDPFAPSDNANSTNTNSGTSNSVNKTTTTNVGTQNEATNKTTNSNGGVANPPATSK